MAGGRKPHVVFVIEGGRSRADVAAIQAVAAEVESSGAQVKLVPHGLGRVSKGAMRKQLREQAPDVVVTTGATSSRDAESLARARGFALVCYYWPAGPIEDIHRRPRHRHQAPKKQLRVSVPHHAVLGSPLHKEVLQRYLGGPHVQVEVHVLPPLLDEAVFAEAATPTHAGQPVVGVYGGHGRKLPSIACQFVELDATHAAVPSNIQAARSELVRIGECSAIVLIGCGTAEEHEAPRRCATGLLLGKPVLVSGFGEGGKELPLSLPEAPITAHGPLRVAGPDEFEAALTQLLTDLPHLPRTASSSFKEALSPKHVQKQHATLLLRIAHERHARAAAKKDNVAGRLLTRLRTLLRREKA